MQTARDILSRKKAFGASHIATAHPDESALDAARRMNEHRIGSLVVCDASSEIVGIITERDMLTRVVAEERLPASTHVRDVMTTRVRICKPETPVSDLRDIMHEIRIRHIPIVSDSGLVGIVSIGDINALESEALIQTISHLEAYITSG